MRLRELLARVNRFLKQFDGAQDRRNLRELRALEAERENDPYERAARLEVDELLDRARWGRP